MHPRRIEPKEGQESVWDYPRPPRLEELDKLVQTYCNGVLIVETRRAKRVLETSHPPVYYVPLEDVREARFSLHPQRSWCEYKGNTEYWDVEVNGKRVELAAWSYPSPTPAFVGIKDHVGFYAHKMDRCYVDGEEVQAQEGDFYGGWITADIVGPFKGPPGTRGW